MTPDDIVDSGRGLISARRKIEDLQARMNKAAALLESLRPVYGWSEVEPGPLATVAKVLAELTGEKP